LDLLLAEAAAIGLLLITTVPRSVSMSASAGVATTASGMAAARGEVTATAWVAPAMGEPAAAMWISANPTPIAAIKETKAGEREYIGRRTIKIRQGQTPVVWVVIVSIRALIIYLC
jgi:hypothetical protein